jgi:hypothetical protein
VEVLLPFVTPFAFWERVEMIERKGVGWLVVADGPLEDDFGSVKEGVETGVDEFLLVDVVLEDERIGVTGVKLDPAAVNSISAGISAASAKGLVLSSSPSLSSLLSEAGLDTAYTPRLVRRSFRFSTGFSTSLSEELDVEEQSESESESSDEPLSELSSSRLGAYPPLPFFSQVSHKQCLFFLPTTTS